MNKGIAGKKLSRTTNERQQLFRNLVGELVDHSFVVTSLTKAKSIVPLVDRLVTVAKKDNLTSYRRLLAETANKQTALRVLELGKLFAMRPGGYTRIIRLGNRQGDNSQQVRLELVDKLAVAQTIAPKKVVKAEVVKKALEAKKLTGPKKIRKTKKV
ncbi:MAG: 50S ribosomal protein L17 [Patescibacteria group bacterium]